MKLRWILYWVFTGRAHPEHVEAARRHYGLPRWRHKKRGSAYSEVGTARLQVADAGALRDMEEMIVYRGDDGQLWVRPALEFHDGRFEIVQ